VTGVQTQDVPIPAPEQRGALPSAGQCCRLSEELDEVLRLASGETVPVRVLVEHLSGRGNALLAFIVILPFLQPIPLPGLSTPFGIAIVLLGVAMALGRPLWLPKRWLDHELRSALVIRIGGGGQRLIRKVERFIKPRGLWFHRHRWAHSIAGIVIAVSGAELALPLPIVFTNTLPALTIATTAVGLIEEDAVLAIIGQALFLVGLAVFGGILVLPFLGLHLIF
jgi:hypothetical protein